MILHSRHLASKPAGLLVSLELPSPKDGLLPCPSSISSLRFLVYKVLLTLCVVTGEILLCSAEDKPPRGLSPSCVTMNAVIGEPEKASGGERGASVPVPFLS